MLRIKKKPLIIKESISIVPSYVSRVQYTVVKVILF